MGGLWVVRVSLNTSHNASLRVICVNNRDQKKPYKTRHLVTQLDPSYGWLDRL
jgi:hypothetical protein